MTINDPVGEAEGGTPPAAACSAYGGARRRVSAFVSSLSSADVRRMVPACPEWNVHDVLAHLVGSATDVVAGRLDGVGSAPWTQAQVESRRGRSCDDLLTEWSEAGPPFEQLLAGFPPEIANLAVGDLITHEHDVRAACRDRGGRDTPEYDVALQYQVAALGTRLDGAGLGALCLKAGHEEWVVGPGEALTTVTASRHDLLRALSSRRSADQIRAMNWDGDPGGYLVVFGAYGPLPERSLAD